MSCDSFGLAESKQNTQRPDNINMRQRPAKNGQTISMHCAMDRHDGFVEGNVKRLIVELESGINYNFG
jgi:hypothetical protein